MDNIFEIISNIDENGNVSLIEELNLELGLLQQPSQIDNLVEIEHDDASMGSDISNTNNPTYDPETRIDNHKRKRSRKGQGTSSNWIRNKNKIKRMKGQEYEGVKKGDGGRYRQDVTRKKKEIGPICGDYCKRKCKNKITEEQRKELFSYFYNELDWDQRKIYVNSLIDTLPIQRPQGGKKERTLIYNLKVNTKKVQVCKATFLNTFSLKSTCVRSWLMQGSEHEGMVQTQKERTTPSKKKISDLHKRESANNFLVSLDKLPSHYCRQSSSKKFIDPLIDSIQKLYDTYVEHCERNDVQDIACKQVLKQELEKENISLYIPRKDQCDTCVKYEEGNLSEDVYNAHIARKDRAAIEKDIIQEKAKQNDNIVFFSMDLEAVLLAPRLTASAQYYKTKLACHNFTIMDNVSRDVKCYFWHQGDGTMEASVFTTCILDHLNSLPPHVDSVFIISDNCFYQNKNIVLANGILEYAIKSSKMVTQLFLVSGHTHLNVDTVHSIIERKLRNKKIFGPSNYVNLIRQCRPGQPFEVEYLDFSFFLDYSEKSSMAYSSLKPTGHSTVSNIVAVRYNPDGTMQYKVDFDEEFMEYRRRNSLRESRNSQTVARPKLFHSCCKIPSAKYKHLQELKEYIDKDYHGFYDGLPHD